MTDIVERLRARADEQERNDSYPVDRAMDREAANEIERLRGQLRGAVFSDSDYCKIVEADNERLRNNSDVALHEATRLLKIFVAENFPPNPDWKPQPDLLGVILQLDNACTIARDYKAEIERLRGGLRMLVTQEYDAGYSPETFADAVLSGHEPGE